MTSIVENIKHYQKSIDRSLNDESRLLHCIAKLYRLPVSVQHLQETGIGRTVNGLRKYDGEVGVAAKALVSKWKSMVAAEESEDGGGNGGCGQQSGGNNYDHQQDEDDADNYDESRLQVDEDPNEEDGNDFDQDMHDQEDHESPRQEARPEEYRQVEVDEDNESEPEPEKVSKHKSEEHRKSSSSKSRDRHEKDSTSHHSSKKRHSSSSSSKKSSSESDKKGKHKSSGSSSSSERKSSSQQSSEKESSQSVSQEKSGSSSSSSKHHSSTKVSSKEDSNGYKKEESKRRRSEEVDELSNSKKIKKEESNGKSSSKSSSKSSKSSSSSGSKDKSKKSSSSEKKRESSSKEKSPRSDDDEVEGLDSSAGASFADALAMIGMPSSSSTKKKSSSDKPKQSSSSSMPPPAASVRSEKSSSHSSSSSKSSRHKESSSSKSTASNSGYNSSSSSSSVGSAVPLLARNVALDPLPEASEIVEALPIISPHYKPMPLNQTVMGCVFGSTAGRPPKSHLTEEEALGHSMQSKNQRTKVYSGVKTYNGKVPSLFDSCIRMLQENIDLLDVTGGVPFDLLKPVLDRASPEQLINLENCNPYLMDDSDVLWEQHCKRQFRTQKRKEEECESWREMYMRCSEERDAKLRSLTQNIKMSQAEKVAPVRKTQLAYVDSAVKPPRSVISKQARYGTDRTPVVSPAARVAALKNASSNVAKAGDTRLKVAPGVRDTAQAVFQPMKPKKAPMMTKVMNSIKGIKGFRR